MRKTSFLSVPIVAMFLILVIMPAGMAAADSTTAQVITTTGSSTLYCSPDHAIIDLDVVTNAVTLTLAQTNNATSANAVLAALNKAGVLKTQIGTSDYSITPQYDSQNSLTGYQVENDIQVTLNHMSAVGSIIDTAVAAGANQVNDIEFSSQDASSVEQEALTLACQDAKAKAEVIASALGVKITGIYDVNASDNSQSPVPVLNGEAMAAVAATSVSAPSQKITTNVTVDFTFAN